MRVNCNSNVKVFQKYDSDGARLNLHYESPVQPLLLNQIRTSMTAISCAENDIIHFTNPEDLVSFEKPRCAPISKLDGDLLAV